MHIVDRYPKTFAVLHGSSEHAYQTSLNHPLYNPQLEAVQIVNHALL